VRDEFNKVIECGTGALGIAIYVSEAGEELEVAFTCKSRICSSCGRKATLDWVRRMNLELPDCPYFDIMLTIRGVMWPLFKSNRDLLNALPTIAAGILQDWARKKYQADIIVIAVLHTFGGDFEFKPHLHLLVSRTGLHSTRTRLVTGIDFPLNMVESEWTHRVVDYLRDVNAGGLLQSKRTRVETAEKLDYEFGLWWKCGIRKTSNPHRYISYIARYLRRPPIANRNVVSIQNQKVVYIGKDTRTQTRKRMEVSTQEFIDRLIAQLKKRYTNSVHYFGLLSPRSKASAYIIFMALLGQRRVKRIKPMRWRSRLIVEFGRDPLADSDGNVMKWSRNVIPKMRQTHS
jgi:hypothetical protein